MTDFTGTVHPLLGSSQFNRPGPYDHEYDSPTGSAYGTEHPADKALGAKRRISNLKALAKGMPSTGEM